MHQVEVVLPADHTGQCGNNVCLSQAIPWKLLFQVIIIKLNTMTASDMRMHHVLIILTLTFIQGHTDLNG